MPVRLLVTVLKALTDELPESELDEVTLCATEDANDAEILDKAMTGALGSSDDVRDGDTAATAM